MNPIRVIYPPELEQQYKDFIDQYPNILKVLYPEDVKNLYDEGALSAFECISRVRRYYKLDDSEV